ncbi:MAG: hypothetical protein JWN09_1745 [Microbacteriaceae bacterium]|nr:hypothetical protein [Microbacteriaceae bacterium]
MDLIPTDKTHRVAEASPADAFSPVDWADAFTRWSPPVHLDVDVLPAVHHGAFLGSQTDHISNSKDGSVLHTLTQFKRSAFVVLGAAVTVGALAGTAVPASAAEHGHGDAPTGYTIKAFSPVGAESNPDDLTRLDGFVYVSYQNGVGTKGEASASGVAASTIQQYSLNGRAGKSWQVVGKVDGIATDARTHRLLITTNEDGNSSFSTLAPASAHPLTTYAYSGLTHGGGTDAISVVDNRILVSASAPTVASGPAVYQVDLRGSTANLTSAFADNAAAKAANGPQTGATIALSLTDPDSNTVVPRSSPRFGGDFMLTAQADKQLVFVPNPGSGTQQLQALSVSQPMDDTAFATGARQTLWVTDPVKNTVYSVTGPFTPDEAIASVSPDTGPAYLASLNLNSGNLTPIKELASIQPKGLLFAGASEDSARGE